MTKIAILGATGHLAKGLIFEFASRRDYKLLLYARRPHAVTQFLTEQGLNNADILVGDFDSFGSVHCDTIVNAIGAGDPKMVRSLGADILRVTEKFDDMALHYVRSHPDARYIFLSSGAVYSADSGEPASENRDQTGDAYGLAKAAAEKKHRALADQCIFDIRVFGYFSRFIDPTGEFFMAELARAIAGKQDFVTNCGDMVRDYSIPCDLASLVEICVRTEFGNMALDLFSSKPVGKFELLAAVEEMFGIGHVVCSDAASAVSSGRRNRYFSECRVASELGYEPEYSSLDGVLSELAIFYEMLPAVGEGIQS